MIIGSKLFFYKDLPSTNSMAITLLKENKMPEGSVIYAGYQTSGRGQLGNKWESEENKNLLISIVLYPSMIRPDDQFLLSMSVSLGICDFLNQFIPDISIKWPNDIYVKNDKIAGILIENSILGDHIEHAIAGIGININQEKFLSDAPNPVSLSILTGRQYDLDDCLRQLSRELDKRYKQLISEDFDLLQRDYCSMLYRRDQWCSFQDTDGIFTGRISDVTGLGRLKVEREDGVVSEYSFKEIDFIL
jgi:BirA family transcriptional regulator, biotin operon repressor / biotin---[acetyl-CoA-carboxylase] ligase